MKRKCKPAPSVLKKGLALTLAMIFDAAPDQQGRGGDAGPA
jgi:hypothetical protein